MTSCVTCFGSGRVTCPSCHGRKFHGRRTGRGDVESSTCLACTGTGKVKCSFCSGTGAVDPGGPGPPPPPPGWPPPPPPSKDPLQGRWIAADGSWYDFTKKKEGYSARAQSQGVLTEGTAKRTGKHVQVDMEIPMLGIVSIGFQLSGESLVGSINMMGMVISTVFRRQ